MRKTYIINDTHLGVRRRSGTTLASREALSEFMYQQFQQLLHLADGHHLIILGDLFDGYQVSKKDEIRTFQLLSQWQQRNAQQQLILVAGNHDLSRNSKDISSFENLCTYLTHQNHPHTHAVIHQPYVQAEQQLAIIPHMPTQQQFDHAIDQLIQQPHNLRYLLLHCNYHNHFAQQNDHSLNLSEATAQQLATHNIQLIIAHEHQPRDLNNVHIIGNQIPSSIADCLGNHSKRLAYLANHQLHYHTLLHITDLYAEHPWQNDALPDCPFIRITGTADYTQAAEVIQRIAHFRQQSQAYIISNAVNIHTLNTPLDPTAELNELNIPQLILKELPPHLAARFQELMQYIPQ